MSVDPDTLPVAFTLDITCEHRVEFTRAERALLRDLASDAYEAEAREALGELDASFREWRKKQRLSSDLIADIHDFHQRGARELYSVYRGLDDASAVARGVAFGFIAKTKVPRAILQKLDVDLWRNAADERRGVSDV